MRFVKGFFIVYLSVCSLQVFQKILDGRVTIGTGICILFIFAFFIFLLSKSFFKKVNQKPKTKIGMRLKVDWEKFKTDIKNPFQKEEKKEQRPYKVFTPSELEIESGGLGFDRKGIQHIKINYQDYYGNYTSRSLEVYEAFKKGDDWFINCFCYSSHGDRTFKVNRIESMLILKNHRRMTDQEEMIKYLKHFSY